MTPELTAATRGFHATALLVRLAQPHRISSLPFPSTDIRQDFDIRGVWDEILLRDRDEADLAIPRQVWRRIDRSPIARSAGRTATKPSATHATWVQTLYEQSRETITDEHIVGMFDALESQVYENLADLDTSLSEIDVDRLATEFVVGIPRALFVLRDVLPNWQNFVQRAWVALSNRSGLDVKELLQGLL